MKCEWCGSLIANRTGNCPHCGGYNEEIDVLAEFRKQMDEMDAAIDQFLVWLFGFTALLLIGLFVYSILTI